MNILSYNAAVAKRCGNNGIIKAVLVNYIYNYHKLNIRKGPGHPAQISLAEFAFRYQHKDTALWRRSFIHKILTDLAKDGQIIKNIEEGVPVFSVSSEIVGLLNAPNAQVISFDLGQACEEGIHVAIIERYLKHVIKSSPKGIAYGLKVEDMAEVNRLSPAQIYRAIRFLVKEERLKREKVRVKGKSRSLALSFGKKV